eukprot:CAMPEP_0178992996 /NCGR_PEP_ID=MMETSP0795-20121207/6438_1 /TAXON_ID=88552 /ORGANISM="Amoebophrya sp., Strain Ameob2" /LENGTH=280 /DNA_ID=CAMNT_0020684967 /DNA_START=457 /DNA_END=1300 /DNA_ORIENTATION=+
MSGAQATFKDPAAGYAIGPAETTNRMRSFFDSSLADVGSWRGDFFPTSTSAPTHSSRQPPLARHGLPATPTAFPQIALTQHGISYDPRQLSLSDATESSRFKRDNAAAYNDQPGDSGNSLFDQGDRERRALENAELLKKGGFLGGGPDLVNPDCRLMLWSYTCGWRSGDPAMLDIDLQQADTAGAGAVTEDQFGNASEALSTSALRDKNLAEHLLEGVKKRPRENFKLLSVKPPGGGGTTGGEYDYTDPGVAATATTLAKAIGAQPDPTKEANKLIHRIH